jgi:riboflavin synthase
MQGHVDGTGELVDAQPVGEGYTVRIGFPRQLGRYIVEKGSIAVDGISLTVALLREGSAGPAALGIQIVPHTRSHTNLSDRRLTDIVNLEADIIGKYAARLRSLA